MRTKEIGFMNKDLASEGVIRKRSEISNGISLANTQHNNYHGDMQIIAVSYMKRVMELILLICNY